MNRICNIIWSKTKERWIVVSEKVKGNGKVPSSILRSIALLVAMYAFPGQACAIDPGALPAGARITSGNGSIAISGTRMTVNQSSQKMIANWQSFNIGENASVHFSQPNSSAVALNRVSDQNPSQIMGSLSANGLIFLLNQAGIIFGKSATVNVGGLVASSLNMLDSDFLAAKYKFFTSGNAGKILNQGSISIIQGGVVALIAPKVTNEGTITARSGSVALGAGNKVSVDFTGDGLITLTVDEGTIDALVENKGLVKADGGLVIMTASAADALSKSTVNNTGIIEANSFQLKEGRILLDAVGGMTTVTGTLDASSADGKGGQVVATGDRVLVKDGAHLTASGATGGGEVLVGGNWQGKDTSIHQATGTIVEQGALLEANATDTGNGGTVVAWSDVTNPLSVTRAYGTFEAMGGPNGGDGGLIETSGHWLDVAGIWVSASGRKGKTGLWLLDPYDVTIGDSVSGDVYTSPPQDFTPTTQNSTILASDIGLALKDFDVVITTGTPGSGNITGDIVVNSTVNISSRTLSLLADGAVTINAGISGGGGQLVLQSGTNGAFNKAVTINSSILLGGGKLKITSTGGVQSYAEIQAVGLLELYGTGDFNLNYTGNSSDYDYFTANVDGSINLYENSDFIHILPAGVTATGNVTLRVERQIYVDGPISITGSGNLVLKISGNSLTTGDNFIITTSPITLNSGSVSFETATYTGVYTLGSSITVSSGGITFDQPVTLSGSQLISCNGPLTFKSTLLAISDTILEANNFLFSGSVTGNSTNQITLMPYNVDDNMTIGTGENIDLSKISGFSSLTFGRADGTGTVTFTGSNPETPYSFTSSIMLQSGGTGGSVIIDKAISTTDAQVTFNAGGLLSINQSVDTQTGAISLTGDVITIADTKSVISSSGGAITISANTLTLPGTATLSSAGSLTITPKTTGTTIGIAGGSGILALPASYFTGGFSDITIGNATTGDVTIGGNLTLMNNFSLISGGAIVLNGALTATGNTIALKGTVTEGTNGSLFADKLVLIGGNVTLSNPGNMVNTLAASGVDNLTYLNSDALTIGTAGGINGIINTTGTVNVATQTGNLTVSQTIATSDASTNAVTLNAGRNTAAITTTGGDIIISGGSITVGSGGLAKLYTGSISGSTGMTSLIGSGSGNFRYASNESTTNYSLALSTGISAIYREQPLLTVTPGRNTITYGDTTPGFAGTYGSYANGDTSPGTVTGTATWMINGSAQTASYKAGSYNVTYSSGLGSSLGYGFTDNVSSINTLTVNPKIVTLSASKIYDGTTSLAGAVTIVTGVGSETLTYSNAVATDANVATANKSISTITLADGSGLASNYQLPTLSSTTAPLTITPKTVTLSATKIYDGTSSLAGAVTIVTGVGGETLSYTNALASDTSVDTANNAISTITLADGTGLASNYQLPSLSYSTAPVTIITNQSSLNSLANRVSSSVVSSIQSASKSTPITGTGDISSATSSAAITTVATESSSDTTALAAVSSSATTTGAAVSSSATSSSSTTNAETAANTGSNARSNNAATRAQMAAGSMMPGLPGAIPGLPSAIQGSAFNVGAFAQIIENTFTTSSLAEFVSSPDQLSLSSGRPLFGRQRYNAASKKTKRSDAPPDPVAFGTMGTLGYLTVYLFAMFNKNR